MNSSDNEDEDGLKTLNTTALLLLLQILSSVVFKKHENESQMRVITSRSWVFIRKSQLGSSGNVLIEWDRFKKKTVQDTKYFEIIST
jgi:hypothetical protein